MTPIDQNEDSEMKEDGHTDGEANASEVVNDDFEIDEVVMEEALLHEEELGLKQASCKAAEEKCVGVMYRVLYIYMYTHIFKLLVLLFHKI